MGCDCSKTWSQSTAAEVITEKEKDASADADVITLTFDPADVAAFQAVFAQRNRAAEQQRVEDQRNAVAAAAAREEAQRHEQETREKDWDQFDKEQRLDRERILSEAHRSGSTSTAADANVLTLC